VSHIIDKFDARLGAKIEAERARRDWSLRDLADRAGVSRAMISKIERGEVSATAALLGRLAAALDLSLSQLMLMTEAGADRVSRAADQALWRDPETGYTRRQRSPARSGSRMEIAEIELPAGKAVDFPASSYAYLDHQILVLEGQLDFTRDGEMFALGVGDCLHIGAPADCEYRNATEESCRYLVVLTRI
jgi:transcriptional regulator with XRE-family HTH domain